MPLSCGHKARIRLMMVFFALAGTSAHAQSDAERRFSTLDQSIEALKETVVEINREALDIERSVITPDYRRLDVYLHVRTGVVLDELTVTIDDQRPVVHHYTEADAKALLVNNSLQRLLSVGIEPGRHRIRVSFTGHALDGKADAPPLTDRYEAVFEKTEAPAELELVISRERAFSGGVKLSMKQWKAAP